MCVQFVELSRTCNGLEGTRAGSFAEDSAQLLPPLRSRGTATRRNSFSNEGLWVPSTLRVGALREEVLCALGKATRTLLGPASFRQLRDERNTFLSAHLEVNSRARPPHPAPSRRSSRTSPARAPREERRTPGACDAPREP
jgi:hypothetical protein